jgi:hypothetical protein
MLYGTVDYTLKDGRSATVDWSARSRFVEETGGELKMDFYQVYLVSSSGVLLEDGVLANSAAGYCSNGQCQIVRGMFSATLDTDGSFANDYFNCAMQSF